MEDRTATESEMSKDELRTFILEWFQNDMYGYIGEESTGNVIIDGEFDLDDLAAKILEKVNKRTGKD